MQIAEILTPDRIQCKVVCKSKKDSLDILAKSIANGDASLTQTEVFNCLLARERLGSTGLGHGIAIPHGRLKHSNITIAAFLQLKNGINYDAVDEQPVDLLFALIVPEKSTDEHLQILSRLAEMFSDKKLVDRIRRKSRPASVYEFLTR
jgi:PTS system nitrogen regulatory IIA component